VKQTRCTTCDADHEYKQAKLPATRRKKPEGTLVTDPPAVAGARPPLPAIDPDAEPDSAAVDEDLAAPAALFEEPAPLQSAGAASPESAESADPESEPDTPEDEWVHRPLIRATLPRPEGQVPERKAPDFTIRQNGGRFDGQRNGNNRHRGPRQAPHSPSQPRFTNPRSGSGHGSPRSGSGQGGPGQPSSGHGQRQGNRPGPPGGQRGGGRPAGQGRGQGRGPKRGR
jgi:translation initiation factor IF-2